MYYAEGWRGSQIIIALYSYFFIALIMANIWAIKKFADSAKEKLEKEVATRRHHSWPSKKVLIKKIVNFCVGKKKRIAKNYVKMPLLFCWTRDKLDGTRLSDGIFPSLLPPGNPCHQLLIHAFFPVNLKSA